MNIIRKGILIIGFLLVGVSGAFATTYYVAPSGSDSNNGTSTNTPMLTINAAVTAASAAGDVIQVMTGSYHETVSVWQDNITLMAYPNNTPIIDGELTLPAHNWGVLLRISGNHNHVSGFEVKNCNMVGAWLGGYGVYIDGHHNVVSHMNVHEIWETGILVQGDYNIVEYSAVWQAAKSNSINNGSSTWAQGISVARNVDPSALIPGITSYAIVRHNTVYNNWGEGLACFESDHCTVEDNIVYDNWTVNLYISDATNSLVQRNIAYVSANPAIATRNNYKPAGITLADEVSSVPRSAGNTLVNNFVYNADFDAFNWTIVVGAGLNNVLISNNTIVDGGLNTGNAASDVVNINSKIVNNIIVNPTSSVPDTTGIYIANNIWTATDPTILALNNIPGDPKIARTGPVAGGTLTPNYFKVLAGSAAINAAAVQAEVTRDFFATIRGSAPDIGGYEYQNTVYLSGTRQRRRKR